MLNLEQQHIFEQMEVNIRLTCELCQETKEFAVPPFHTVEQTDNHPFPFEEYERIAVAFSDIGWRVLAQPNKLDDYHKASRKILLEDLGVSEEDLPLPEPGEPVVVCRVCACLLDEQSKTDRPESASSNLT
jgi:hypothetical protein